MELFREPGPEINKLFLTATQLKASHVFLQPGSPPKLRLRGITRTLDCHVMSNNDIEQLLSPIMSVEQQQTLAESNAVGFIYAFVKKYRFYVYVTKDGESLRMSAYWLAAEMFSEDAADD